MTKERSVTIRLRSRKNRLEGDCIARQCACTGVDSSGEEGELQAFPWARGFCPCHKFLKAHALKYEPGQRVSPKLDCPTVLATLRRALADSQQIGTWGTHSCRRGGCAAI
eukprot:GSA25T00020378001.1